MIKLNAEKFQWSISEQVYPFEKSNDGSILYCKEVLMGQMPQAQGQLLVAHGIPAGEKLHSIVGVMYKPGSDNIRPLPAITPSDYTYNVGFECTDTYLYVHAWVSYWYSQGYYVKVKIIYSK